MRSLWAAGLLLRRLRAEWAIAVLTFVLVASTSVAFAAAPRLFNRVSDDALRQAVDSAAPAQRDLSLSVTGSIGPGSGRGVSGVEAQGDKLAQQFPASLAGLVSDRLLRVTSVRLSVEQPPVYDTRISLRYQDGMADATRLVAGRWPTDRGTPLRLVPGYGGSNEGSQPEPPEPAVFEVALSSATASVTGIKLGDRLAVTLDDTGGLDIRQFRLKIEPTELEVVGLYEPVDPSSESWAGDAGLLEPTLEGVPDPRIAYATAYISADMYPGLWSSGLPFRYEWRFALAAARLDASQVARVASDIRGLTLRLGSTQVDSGGTAAGEFARVVTVQTGLSRILDQFAAEQATAGSALSIATIGPLGLAGGAMAMVALLLIRRRAAALALTTGRGASGTLVLGTELWEAIVLAGGASLLGLLVAVLVVPGRASPLTPFLAVGVGVAAIMLLLGLSWAALRRPTGPSERDDAPVLRVSPRRLVIEMTIVGISIAAALLLRQRGLTIAAPGALAQADPLLAAVPVLGGLAAGIVAARLYPLPIRVLGWLASRRRDIVPVLGLRTVGRQPAAANVSLLVLMLTAAFAACASVIASSLDRGQVVASYLAVGADYRLEAVSNGPLPPTLDPAGIPGVRAVAPGIVDRSAPVSGLGQTAHLFVEAVDPSAYDEVVAGSAAEPRWPAAFLAPPAGSSLGTPDQPIPAILSTSLQRTGQALSLGDTFQLTIDGRAMTFRLVEQRATFAGIDERLPFAVVPFNWVEAAIGGTVLPSAEWLRASGEVAAALAARPEVAGAVRIVSRYEAYAALHDRPLNAAIGAGYTLALVVAAAYMAITIIGAMILSAARRTRDLAYLRTLGVSLPEALGLTIVEHATPVLVAVVPGVALGIGIAMLCEPGLGLDTFVGMSGVPLFIDWPGLASIIVAMIGLVAAAIAAGTWLAGRARLTEALRFEER